MLSVKSFIDPGKYNFLWFPVVPEEAIAFIDCHLVYERYLQYKLWVSTFFCKRRFICRLAGQRRLCVVFSAMSLWLAAVPGEGPRPASLQKLASGFAVSAADMLSSLEWTVSVFTWEVPKGHPLRQYGAEDSNALQVIVIEKGRYTPAAELTTLEKDAYDNLYEKGGLMMTTEDGGESDTTLTLSDGFHEQRVVKIILRLENHSSD